MRTAHIGASAAALADGALDHEERDRLLAHIAACERCRLDVEQQRAVARRVRALPPPEPAAALRARLLAIPADEIEARHAAAGGPAMGTSTNGGVAVATQTRPPQARTARHHLLRRGRRGHHGRAAVVVVGAAASVVGVLGGAVALGGSDSGSGTVVDPSSERYAVEHATTAGEVPFTSGVVGVAFSYAGPANGSADGSAGGNWSATLPSPQDQPVWP